jgi:hypothetical protein
VEANARRQHARGIRDDDHDLLAAAAHRHPDDDDSDAHAVDHPAADRDYHPARQRQWWR